MIRKAPPAAGPTATAGRARAMPELRGAVRSGTAGCGPNRDHAVTTGRARTSGDGVVPVGRADLGSYASTHAHLGTPGHGTRKGTVGRERAGGAA